jgi:hypothetical protein
MKASEDVEASDESIESIEADRRNLQQQAERIGQLKSELRQEVRANLANATDRGTYQAKRSPNYFVGTENG